jgi:hypothetical protein
MQIYKHFTKVMVHTQSYVSKESKYFEIYYKNNSTIC